MFARADMFGYILADKSKLAPPEEARYKAAYCGLCSMLHSRFSLTSRLTVSFDMTFLILLLDSLYEPERESSLRRCPMHPVKCRTHHHSTHTEYAADMTVALFYHKALDDIKDGPSPASLALKSILEPHYRKVRERYPELCGLFEEELAKLSELESQNAPADETAACFGRITAALFSPKADRWQPVLWELGFHLGRFIYMMDAWDDCEKDIKKGEYNPLADLRSAAGYRETVEGILTGIMAQCANAFEQLPLVEDIAVLRNILYSGVWMKYHIKGMSSTKNGNLLKDAKGGAAGDRSI